MDARPPLFTTSRSEFTQIPLRYAPTLTVRVSYSGFDAAPLAEQLSQYTPVRIPYKAPVDWAKYGTAAGVTLILLSGVRLFLPILRNRWAWATGIVITSLVMTSGFMFVRIRGMPTSGPNGQWIAQGYQNQFGQEVQVISFICEYLLMLC